MTNAAVMNGPAATWATITTLTIIRNPGSTALPHDARELHGISKKADEIALLHSHSPTL